MKILSFILLFWSVSLAVLGQESNLSPFIIKVSLKDGSTLFEGSQNFQEANLQGKLIFRQDSTEIPDVPHSQNSLLLLFTAPQDYNEYSYYLEGYDKDWSTWSIETAKQYINLKSEQYYIFHLKTRNPSKKVSREARFEFYIQAPWYRTFWAYITYVFLIFLFLRVLLNVFLKNKN